MKDRLNRRVEKPQQINHKQLSCKDNFNENGPLLYSPQGLHITLTKPLHWIRNLWNILIITLVWPTFVRLYATPGNITREPAIDYGGTLGSNSSAVYQHPVSLY